MIERRYYLLADLGQCSYVQERTGIINNYKHSICGISIN
jgi:hypothetical protein